MIRSLVLLACLAGPAAAQGYGIPPVLAPCADRHLDPAQYGRDLTALGWVFIPAETRAAQLTLLNETFVTMVAGQDGPRTDRIEKARPVWADLGRSQMVFAAPDGGAQTLMLSGGQNEEGVTQLRCWMAIEDGSRIDDTYEELLANADGAPEAGEEQIIVLTPEAAAPDESFQIYLTRPTPGIDTPAIHAGISTILTITPDPAE